MTVGLERAGRRSAPDRIERQALDFFERVRQGYLGLAAAQPERFRVIDASQSLQQVARQVGATIERFLDEVPG